MLCEIEVQKGSFAAGDAGGLQPFPRTLCAVPGLRTVSGPERGVLMKGKQLEGLKALGAHSSLPELQVLGLFGSGTPIVFRVWLGVWMSGPTSI